MELSDLEIGDKFMVCSGAGTLKLPQCYLTTYLPHELISVVWRFQHMINESLISNYYLRT